MSVAPPPVRFPFVGQIAAGRREGIVLKIDSYRPFRIGAIHRNGDVERSRSEAGGLGGYGSLVDPEIEEGSIYTYVDKFSVGITAGQDQPGSRGGNLHRVRVHVPIGFQVHGVGAGKPSFGGHDVDAAGGEGQGRFGRHVGLSVGEHDDEVLIVSVRSFFEADHVAVRNQLSRAVACRIDAGPVSHSIRIVLIFGEERAGSATGGNVNTESVFGVNRKRSTAAAYGGKECLCVGQAIGQHADLIQRDRVIALRVEAERRRGGRRVTRYHLYPDRSG